MNNLMITGRQQQQQQQQQRSQSQQRPLSSWSETNLDTGHTIDHGYSNYEYEVNRSLATPGHYNQVNMEIPLYVDTRAPSDVTSPLTSEDVQHGGFGKF